MERPRWKEGRQACHNRSVCLPALREIRRSRGLTQRELARLAGTSPHTVLHLESGRRGAYAITVRKLAAALGISSAELVRRPD